MARKNSRFVYARPSFIEGMARVLDLGGTLNVYHNLPAGEPAGPFRYRCRPAKALGCGRRAYALRHR